MEQKIENGIYYENGEPKHAGVVRVNGEIYYAGHKGEIVTGQKVVHGSMSNGILKHGTYKFDSDGKLIKGYYLAPEKKKSAKRKAEIGLFSPSVVLIASIVVSIIVISVLIVINGMSGAGIGGAEEEEFYADAFVRTAVTMPNFDDEVYLCSDSLAQYYKGNKSLETVFSDKEQPYKGLSFDYSLPNYSTAILEIDGRSLPLSSSEKSFVIDNLMTGKTYNYKVTVTQNINNDVKTTIYDGVVETADSNRFVTIGGLNNTRDIGGYKTNDGKTIRQGLLIRGSEADGLTNKNHYLTSIDDAALFGFNSEFDLRNNVSVTASKLGNEVDYKTFPMSTTGTVISNGSEASLKKLFSELANAQNYPVYLHGTNGTDRTGAVVYLLQGILGVSEEDLDFEYRLSSLTTQTGNINMIKGNLDAYEGETINERIETYLTEKVGVTAGEISAIRSIFLE